jgi:hypothetical protein
MERIEGVKKSFFEVCCGEASPEVRRRYTRGLLIWMGVYIAVLFVSIRVIHAFPAGRWQAPVALLPMIPMFFTMRTILNYLRQIDEMQRQVQFEALAIGFAGTAFTTFGYGFLQTVGFPDVSWFAIWPIMAVFWVAGHFFAARRYR